MRKRSVTRFVSPIVLGWLIFVAALAAASGPRQAADALPQTDHVVTLEDFSDVVTAVDLGLDDFSGSMGAIHDEYATTSLQCADPASCALRLAWNFGSAEEGFTGVFFSLFGLTDTQITTDGTTVETVRFPEHHLDLDRIDGALEEPGGPRRFLDLCLSLTYTQTEALKLRLEVKDVQEPQQGIRFTRLDVSGAPQPQQFCWDFRDPGSYAVPGGSPDLDVHSAKELVLVVERKHVADGIENPISGTLDLHRVWFTADRAEDEPQDDLALLDLAERRSYQYFLDWSSRKPASLGMAQDRSTSGGLLTVGGTGFGLAAHAVAAERGWIARDEAAARTLATLRVLDDPGVFGPEPVGRIGYRGWFYHFLGGDGRRKLNFDLSATPADESLDTVELSTIDTGLVLMGALAAQSYFDDPSDAAEVEIRQRVQAIYDRVDWSFMLEPTSQQFYLGWKPNEAREGPPFEIADAEGLGSYSGAPGSPATLDRYTDEALIVILLASGALADPVPTEVYAALELCDQGGLIATWPGSLFTYQFLHAFLDTRAFRPCSPTSWYENARQAMLAAMAYAEENPAGFATYGPDAWGLSAAEGPFDSYHAYGAPPLACSPDPEEDGTVTYTGMVSAAGLDLGAQVVSAVRAAWQRGHWHPRFGLPDAFHDEISQADPPGDALRQSGTWVQRALFAIDQGPMVLHLENARSGLVWDLAARNANLQRALARLATVDRVEVEGEAGSGDGQVNSRANASGGETVHLWSGQVRTVPFTTTVSVRYEVQVRYSNDSTRMPEQVYLTLDGQAVGDFTAQATGVDGLGWEVFADSEALGPVDLWPGGHELGIAVEGGDGGGVEIDRVSLDVFDCQPPSLALAKAVYPEGGVFRHAAVTYTLSLANHSTADATEVQVTDTLPVSTTFARWIEQPPGAAVDADRIAWQGTVTAGAAITFSFVATHTGDDGDRVTNGVTYSHAGVTGSAEATFSVRQPCTTYLPATFHSWKPLPGFDYGIQAHSDHKLPQIVSSVQDLGLSWVKQQVRWEDIEGTRGNYGWSGLDAIVDAYHQAGFQVLFSVTAAPDWARPGKPGNGPPDHYADLNRFVSAMAAHFKGRVSAYEIWNEPNVKREWDGVPLSAADYVRLLEGANLAIKSVDPKAVVISAGPAPTGVNDGVWAIDDRIFLRRAYQAGLMEACDAIGAHPYGFANPPDVYFSGGDFDPNRGWDDHPCFFFRNTMEDYYWIMWTNHDGGKRIWATEFGWPTVDGMYVPPNTGQEYAADIDQQQQADYIVRAYTWSRDWGHAGVMVLWNLNYWPAAGAWSEMAKYGIVRSNWAPRPAYTAVKAMPK